MGEAEEQGDNLVAVSGSTIATPQVTTERRMMADQVRARVATLRDQVAESYFEIGRHLHTIQREALYKLWGYESFSEYVDKEVTFKWRKAMYLMKIYRYFALELGDKQVFELVKPLGISKAAALTEVVTTKNASKWVEKAKAMPVKALEDEVRLAKKAAQERKRQREEAAEARRQTESEEARKDREARKGNALYEGGEPDEEPEPDPGVHAKFQGDLGVDPVPEGDRDGVRTYWRVLLDESQRRNVETACKAASHFVDETKSLTQQEKNHDARGYLLDFVATGFLAFHGSTIRENLKKHSATLRNDTLASIERAFGVRVICVDEKTPDVLYGEHHIDALMGDEEGGGGDGEEAA